MNRKTGDDRDRAAATEALMDAAAKLLRGQPTVKAPLSVILERSSEDTKAFNETASRPSSSSSSGSVRARGVVDRRDRSPNNLGNEAMARGSFSNANASTAKRSSTNRLSPNLGIEARGSFNKSYINAGGGGDVNGSFVSLSETQARDLFDNDAKDRIEFLTSQLDQRLEIENNNGDGNSMGLSSVNLPNESLGVYFMRRSSNPVKGISDESSFFQNQLLDDCSMPPDFESTRSINASTPIPNRSTRLQESINRKLTRNPKEDSLFEQSNMEPKNPSLLGLIDYFKGPQSDGKHNESMIDYVLEYCNKQSKMGTSSCSQPALKSPVKLNIEPSRSTLNLNSIHDIPLTNVKLKRRVTESRTHLNVSYREKSFLTQATVTSGENKARNVHPKSTNDSTAAKLTAQLPTKQQKQLAQTQFNSQVVTAATSTTASSSSCNCANTHTNYQYTPPPPPYGFPVVIQVYYPNPQVPYPPYAPGSSGHQMQPSLGPCSTIYLPPAPQPAYVPPPHLHTIAENIHPTAP